MKYLIWFLLLLLVILNIGVFISSIRLADEISFFEIETKKLHRENVELEKEISFYDSYQYAASQAAELGFIKKATPVYLENLQYAFKQ